MTVQTVPSGISASSRYMPSVFLWFKGKIKGIIMEDNKPIDGAEYITLEDTKRLKLPYFEGLAPSCTGIIISTDPIAPYGLPSTNTGVRKFLTPADCQGGRRACQDTVYKKKSEVTIQRNIF